MRDFAKGFTLIELLVVIAIIGILASIVLAALSSSRKSASDSSVKSELNQVATAMELYSDTVSTGNDYGSVYASAICPTTGDPSVFDTYSQVANLIGSLNSINGNATRCAAGTLSASGNASSWAIASPLKTIGQYWCVDSTGNVKLSYYGENEGSILTRALAYIVPMAFAAPVGLNLGGGHGTAAACP